MNEKMCPENQKFSWVVRKSKTPKCVYQFVWSPESSKNQDYVTVCDIARGGPLQRTVIKAPAGRPCGLVGVSEFLEGERVFGRRVQRALAG